MDIRPGSIIEVQRCSDSTFNGSRGMVAMVQDEARLGGLVFHPYIASAGICTETVRIAYEWTVVTPVPEPWNDPEVLRQMRRAVPYLPGTNLSGDTVAELIGNLGQARQTEWHNHTRDLIAVGQALAEAREAYDWCDEYFRRIKQVSLSSDEMRNVFVDAAIPTEETDVIVTATQSRTVTRTVTVTHRPDTDSDEVVEMALTLVREEQDNDEWEDVEETETDWDSLEGDVIE